jgi:hypothetical protein
MSVQEVENMTLAQKRMAAMVMETTVEDVEAHRARQAAAEAEAAAAVGGAGVELEDGTMEQRIWSLQHTQGELEHRRVKRFYSRTNKMQFKRQITQHQRQEQILRKIRLRAEDTIREHRREASQRIALTLHIFYSTRYARVLAKYYYGDYSEKVTISAILRKICGLLRIRCRENRYLPDTSLSGKKVLHRDVNKEQRTLGNMMASSGARASTASGTRSEL